MSIADMDRRLKRLEDLAANRAANERPSAAPIRVAPVITGERAGRTFPNVEELFKQWRAQDPGCESGLEDPQVKQRALCFAEFAIRKSMEYVLKGPSKG